jgi:phosphinothricin acetyltransferase
MRIRDARDGDAEAIAAIYNDAVLHTTAIWNEKTVEADNRRTWIADRCRQGYPVLVAIDDVDDVLGYASFGDWRPFDGYRHTVEHSVYVRKDRRGGGVGKALMIELTARASSLGKHVMVAGVEAANVASIAMHRKLGFAEVGRMSQVGAKFGRWLDLAFLQLTLDGRSEPDDSERV